MGRIVLAAAVIIGALFLGMFIIKGNSKTSKGGSGSGSGGGDESTEARLQELQRLRDKELISEAEYQSKRADVMKDL